MDPRRKASAGLRSSSGTDYYRPSVSESFGVRQSSTLAPGGLSELWLIDWDRNLDEEGGVPGAMKVSRKGQITSQHGVGSPRHLGAGDGVLVCAARAVA